MAFFNFYNQVRAPSVSFKTLRSRLFFRKAKSRSLRLDLASDAVTIDPGFWAYGYMQRTMSTNSSTCDRLASLPPFFSLSSILTAGRSRRGRADTHGRFWGSGLGTTSPSSLVRSVRDIFRVLIWRSVRGTQSEQKGGVVSPRERETTRSPGTDKPRLSFVLSPCPSPPSLPPSRTLNFVPRTRRCSPPPFFPPDLPFRPIFSVPVQRRTSRSAASSTTASFVPSCVIMTPGKNCQCRVSASTCVHMH